MKHELIIKPVGRYSWQLVQDFNIQTSIGIITVPKGKVTDFASVPRILWGLIPPYGRYTEASVVHDYLYSIGYNRKQADKIFYELMLKAEVNKFKAYTMFKAVRLFGWIPYNKKHK